jgi:hypothetical protein
MNNHLPNDPAVGSGGIKAWCWGGGGITFECKKSAIFGI